MNIKDIFSGKIAIFIYGMLIAFIGAFGIVDTIYKERINRLKHENKTYRENNVVCKDNLEQTKKLLKDTGVKSLIKTNESQQEIISKVLNEKKILETEFQKINKELGKRNSQESITLGHNEILMAEGKDITLLVKRVVNLITECKKSGGGMNAKLNEYKNLVKRLKKSLPNDSMIKNIESIKGKIATPSEWHYHERNINISDDIEVQLVLIFNYLKEKYKQQKNQSIEKLSFD